MVQGAREELMLVVYRTICWRFSSAGHELADAVTCPSCESSARLVSSETRQQTGYIGWRFLGEAMSSSWWWWDDCLVYRVIYIGTYRSPSTTCTILYKRYTGSKNKSRCKIKNIRIPRFCNLMLFVSKSFKKKCLHLKTVPTCRNTQNSTACLTKYTPFR